MATSAFLSLPQEIRDLIFEFAIGEDAYDADQVRLSSGYRTKRIPIGNNNRWAFECHHPAQAPFPEYLCLMLCNRQLEREIRKFLQRPQEASRAPAKLTMLLEYPNMWLTWTQLPDPPRQTETLDLLVKVSHMYHPAYISQGSQNAILTAVSDTLKRFVYRGPYLSRPSALSHPLHLETVRITVAPPVPFEDMKQTYGFPAQQLETLFTAFKALLQRFCRSGLPFELIDFFEVKMEDDEKFDRIPVTSNIWDEIDFLLFQYGGFNWEGGLDASDTVTFQPDQLAW